MNRRSPRRTKRVESVTDVSYEIVRLLRYDDHDDDDDDDDHDDDDNDNDNDDDDDDDENEKGIPGIRSYALKDRRHVVVFLLKRPIDLPQRRNVRAAGWYKHLLGINNFDKI
ncbi:uncharacterized protein LOC114931442 isoform X2 [Nylanderia fulva]|uniref:uncharacterized protein LOC114931442 isoform X2 n=1 Tax=Nylanderia fulva TaxID=613905 RepID=UPI0010FB309B|nr:uncharacterized protein LOC114931442 isoform X2 [Nylanderia fulva]